MLTLNVVTGEWTVCVEVKKLVVFSGRVGCWDLVCGQTDTAPQAYDQTITHYLLNVNITDHLFQCSVGVARENPHA